MSLPSMPTQVRPAQGGLLEGYVKLEPPVMQVAVSEGLEVVDCLDDMVIYMEEDVTVGLGSN